VRCGVGGCVWMCLSVCVSLCGWGGVGCVCVCERVRVCVCGRSRARVCLCVCVRAVQCHYFGPMNMCLYVRLRECASVFVYIYVCLVLCA